MHSYSQFKRVLGKQPISKSNPRQHSQKVVFILQHSINFKPLILSLDTKYGNHVASMTGSTNALGAGFTEGVMDGEGRIYIQISTLCIMLHN